MTIDILDRIANSHGRERNAWAETLYLNLRSALTGQGNHVPEFEDFLFNRENRTNVTDYLYKAFEVLGSIEGFEKHALKISDQMRKFYEYETGPSKVLSPERITSYADKFAVRCTGGLIGYIGPNTEDRMFVGKSGHIISRSHLTQKEYDRFVELSAIVTEKLLSQERPVVEDIDDQCIGM